MTLSAVKVDNAYIVFTVITEIALSLNFLPAFNYAQRRTLCDSIINDRYSSEAAQQ